MRDLGGHDADPGEITLRRSQWSRARAMRAFFAELKGVGHGGSLLHKRSDGWNDGVAPYSAIKA
jgi:hypothetical protein